jgi:isochorismate synthase
MQAYALFKLPHSDKIYFTQGQISDDLESIDFANKQIRFVISPFAQKNRAYIIIPNEIKEWEGETFNLCYHQESQESGSKAAYINYVQHAVDTLISHSDIHKFVAARVKNMDKPIDFNAFDMFDKLTINYPSAFSYLLSSDLTGTWVGASPELLLHHQNNVLTTVALAGTLANEQSGTWTDKEIREQKWVEDFIYDTLLPYAESLEKSQTETIHSGELKHLKSTFTANLKPEQNSIGEVLAQLNPTPAVCGLPQDVAHHFITEMEDMDRQLYSGFVGVLNLEDQSHLYVNIRCAQIFEKQINQFAGAGITSSSIPENEWIETENKMAAIGKFIL